jgi:hypothetical protein
LPPPFPAVAAVPDAGVLAFRRRDAREHLHRCTWRRRRSPRSGAVRDRCRLRRGLRTPQQASRLPCMRHCAVHACSAKPVLQVYIYQVFMSSSYILYQGSGRVCAHVSCQKCAQPTFAAPIVTTRTHLYVRRHTAARCCRDAKFRSCLWRQRRPPRPLRAHVTRSDARVRALHRCQTSVCCACGIASRRPASLSRHDLVCAERYYTASRK